jgi:hypothetical protein
VHEKRFGFLSPSITCLTCKDLEHRQEGSTEYENIALFTSIEPGQGKTLRVFLNPEKLF